MEISTRRLRSALLATTVAALAALGGALVPTPARADWVRNDQWQLGVLNTTAAWQYATGRGVTVAVLDSGVDATHQDLTGQVLPGLDLVDGSTDGRVDPVGHGTTVASLIAGRRDAAGVVGVAPGAKILPVRVLDRSNRYQDAHVVARGLRWAVDNGARVVNLSLGGLAHSDELSAALAYAAQHDVVVIACTGNLDDVGDPQMWYPAREPGVVAVAGLGGHGPVGSGQDLPGAGSFANGVEELWSGSRTGPQTVLTAPAANLIGARPGGYWRVQGTSFATPLVTAAASLIRSRYPQMSAANVINRLIRTARDLGPGGRDEWYGFGLVNPLAALTTDVPEVGGNPLLVEREALGHLGSGGGWDGTARSVGGAGRKAGSGADTPASAAPKDEPEHRRQSGSLLTGASLVAGWALAVVLAVAVIAGVVIGAATLRGRRFPQRYLRRARHSG